MHITHSGTSGSSVTDWTYDDAGNLLQIDVITEAGTATETRTVNDLNQILTSTGGWEYVYDDRGCLIVKTNGTAIGDERWEYAWDADNRLIQVKKGVYASAGSPAARYHVTDYGESSYGFGFGLVNEFTVDYEYDLAGRMLRRDDGENVTTFVWDHWDLLGETTGAVTTDYLVPNGLIHSFIRDGELYALNHDALSSVKIITNSGGTVVARVELSAYGEEIFVSAIPELENFPYRFVGGLGVGTDATTGLLYMRNRWYDCSLQRFISRDAVHTSNRFIYAGNNPLAFADYNGLAPTPADSAYGNLRMDTAKTRRTQERLLRILKQFRLQKLSKCFQSLWKKTVVVYGTPYDSNDQGWTTATSSTSGKIRLDQGLNDTDTMLNLYHETLHLAGNIGSGCECTPDDIKTVWDVSEITSVIVTNCFEPTRIERKPFDYPEQMTRFRRQHVWIYLSQAQLWRSLGSKESTNSKAFGDIMSKLNAPGLNHDINQTSTIDRVMPTVEKYFQVGPHDFGL